MTAPTTPPTESLAESLLQLVDSLLEVAGDLDDVTDPSDKVGDDVDHRFDQVQQFVVAARVARTNLRLLLLQQRLEDIQESVDVVRLSHGSDAKPAAGSPSDDSAEHGDPYADPMISTTEHVEREVRRDRDAWDLAVEVVTLLAPQVRDAEKALAAKRLVDLVRLMGGAR